MKDQQTLEGLVITPSRFGTVSDMERRIAALDSAYETIASRLPPEDRALLLEYRQLLKDRSDHKELQAYRSGIQVGQRRMERD